MTTICLARIIGLLPKQKPMDKSEEEDSVLNHLIEEIKRLEIKVDELQDQIKKS